MPRKTSFCNAALLRSDVKRYWPLLFLYVAVWVMILPLPILQAGRWMVSSEQIQGEIHNTIYNALFGSIVMALLFGCLTAMAVWSYLMTTRAVGLLHALPVTRAEQFLSHSIAGLGMLTVGNVFIFLLSAACCAGRSYVDWAILGAWLLLTELMELFFFALASLCAMATGWLLAIPVLYGAVNTLAILLHAVVQAMANIFYYGYYTTGPAKAVMWLTPVGRIWTAIGDDTSYWITADGRVSMEYLEPVEMAQRVTDNGITITADAIVGDTYSYAVVYTIQREDGKALVSDQLLARAPDPENDALPLTFQSYDAALQGYRGGSSGKMWFYDADPADNAIQFVELRTQDEPLEPGVLTVRFQDLQVYGEDYATCTTLTEGSWRLRFQLNFEDASRTLPCGQTFTLDGAEVTLNTVTLSPLSIQADYTVSWAGDTAVDWIEPLSMSITYTDGTTLDLSHAGGSSDYGTGTVSCQKGMIFDQLRPLEEVASVTVGDVVIPVSQP